MINRLVARIWANPPAMQAHKNPQLGCGSTEPVTANATPNSKIAVGVP
jgi:hypothetical protein